MALESRGAAEIKPRAASNSSQGAQDALVAPSPNSPGTWLAKTGLSACEIKVSSPANSSNLIRGTYVCPRPLLLNPEPRRRRRRRRLRRLPQSHATVRCKALGNNPVFNNRGYSEPLTEVQGRNTGGNPAESAIFLDNWVNPGVAVLNSWTLSCT